MKALNCFSGTVLSLYMQTHVRQCFVGVLNSLKENREMMYFACLFGVLNLWLWVCMQLICCWTRLENPLFCLYCFLHSKLFSMLIILCVKMISSHIATY